MGSKDLYHIYILRNNMGIEQIKLPYSPTTLIGESLPGGVRL